MLDHDTTPDAEALTGPTTPTYREQLAMALTAAQTAVEQATEVLDTLTNNDPAFTGAAGEDLEVLLAGTARALRVTSAVARQATR